MCQQVVVCTIVADETAESNGRRRETLSKVAAHPKPRPGESREHACHRLARRPAAGGTAAAHFGGRARATGGARRGARPRRGGLPVRRKVQAGGAAPRGGPASLDRMPECARGERGAEPRVRRERALSHRTTDHAMRRARVRSPQPTPLNLSTSAPCRCPPRRSSPCSCAGTAGWARGAPRA